MRSVLRRTTTTHNPAPSSGPLGPRASKTLVALTALGLCSIGMVATTAAPPPAAAAAAGSDGTLLSANFNTLPAGHLMPSEFIGALGGSDSSPRTYDDASIAGGSSGKGLRTTLDARTIRTQPRGNNGIVVLVPLRKKVTSACLSYDVKFDKNFEWSMGGKLPGLEGVAPGVSPGLPSGGKDPGSLGWSGRVMWRGSRAFPTHGQSNVAVSYMYGPRQKSRYGDNISWNSGFQRGRWHHLKQCYTMNTVGKANGVLRTWKDGRLAVNKTSYTFRTRRDVAITHLAWSVFRGGNTMDWAGSRSDSIDFDNVVVTGR